MKLSLNDIYEYENEDEFSYSASYKRNDKTKVKKMKRD